MLPKIIRNLLRVLDSESVLGITAKFANSGTYLVSSLLAAIYLGPSEQGLFFTCLSLVTLTMVVELGLNTLVIQFTSHEIGAMDTAVDKASYEYALSRLRSIGRLAFVWFWSGAVLFAVIVGAAGYFFFRDVLGADAIFPGPWLVLVVFVSLDLTLYPCWALLEGSGRIKATYGYRSARSFAIGLGTWISLVSGLGLWALPIGYMAALPVALWPIISNRDFFRLFLGGPTTGRVAWKLEVMSLQWRLAVSWVSGYFAQWAITPISLKMFGSAVAGQVGMTWALATGVASISSAVVLVKAARFGYLVATRQFLALDRFVLRQGTIAIGLSLMGTFLVILFDWIATRQGYHRLTDRLVPTDVLALFMLGSALQQSTFPLAVYLRAFKREPYIWLSVAAAVFLALALSIGGGLFGIRGVALCYLASIFITLPASIIIFLRCRSAWTMIPA
jgi:hypothetical protein